ncbi:MAG TPA: DUF1254 domain-containing protein [Bacteroidales bacterium]|nr:DUF1254 domain-containing protein [Bacteroidales bacterium]
MKRILLMIFAAFLLSSAMDACKEKQQLTPQEAKAIAKEAYIYGFPMVMGYKAMNAYILDKNNPEYKGTFNFLACEARLLTPDDKAIVSPNSDTPYCMLWGDLRKEPLVISVPEMEPNRFYHFQLVDLYTHNFAYIGSLSTGTQEGKYLIATTEWQGEKPEGIDDIIYCESPLFFVVVRTQMFGPDDIDKVKAIQAAYNLQTLSEFNGGPTVQRQETIDIPEWHEGDQFSAALFPYLDAMIDLLEPIEEEKAMLDRFSRLGIGAGKEFAMSDFSEDIQEAMQEGVKEGFGEIEDFVRKLNDDPLGSAKIFGTRDFLKQSAKENFQLEEFYLLRAAAAHLGLYGNSGKEAIYPTYLIDAEGKPFDASINKYTLTFAPGLLPPVNSFWSLTMYDGKTQLLVANPLNRYLLNTTMTDGFTWDDDGSLTLYIQKDSPGPELEGNWLPAPDGPFYAVLRLYGPKENALKGEWVKPPMVKMQ